jgi:quinone-modifying oxidoreductase subunit QmoC
MCTSCYNCIVRCPRELPITHIMHGLANYAHRLGIAPKMNPTRLFSSLFWKNLAKGGRVNELKLSIGLYFMNGLIPGVKKSMEMMPVGLGMLKTGRLNPFGLLSGGKCKGSSDIHKMLKKAQEIENRRKGFAS